MNILITNSHSVRNAGDRVLLEVTLAELRANFPGSDITVAMNSTLGSEACAGTHYVGSFMNWFKRVEAGVERWDWRPVPRLPWWMLQALLVALTWRLFRRPWPLPKEGARRALLSAYCDADLLVSCPGNFFYSGSGLGAAFLLHVLALAYVGLLGKPLYMMPQTIGPLTRRRERALLTPLLKRMRFVSLRDAVSLEAVKSLGISEPHCRVFPDTAFLFRGSDDLRPFSELTHDDLPRPHLGVTVIDWGAKNRRFTRQAEYERGLAQAVAAFLERHGGTAFIFPQVTGPSRAEDDRIPAARITEMLGARGSQVVQIDSVWSPNQLQAAYGQMDLFVGTRLHSCIFALTAGAPVLAIAYQYKTRGVFEMVGLSDWVIDIEDVDDTLLVEQLEALWQRRAEVQARCQQGVAAVQADAHRAAAMIAADYEQLTASSHGRQLRIGTPK